MTRTIASLVTIVAVIGAVFAVSPTTAESSSQKGGTLVIGDSMTARSSHAIKAQRPGWRINAVRGRQATKMLKVARVEKYLRGGMPSQVVIAKGSNARGLTLQHYRHILDTMPRSTKVVLVAPWRDAKAFSPARARKMRRITQWMQGLANRRPQVCVARWDRVVERRPNLISRDGVHPTKRGERVFARLMVRTMNRC